LAVGQSTAPQPEGAIVRLDATTYQRVLGDEIRRLRKLRGWTRKDLNERLQSDISLQTLATYELGTRHCSVVRFVEICLALNEHPHELLARVHERVFTDAPVGRIRFDVRKIVRDRTAELLPLRRWAAGRLAAEPGPQGAEVHLDISALERMAELCRMDTIELITRLRQIGGSAIGTPDPAI
jgi:transcriptional regulator with XRE-family HTH domain